MNDERHTPEEQHDSAAMNAPASDTSAHDSAAQLKDIGRQLRKARKAHGESLDDLVRELKLRKVYFQALEKGNWDALPDEVYAVGFLRQYAAHLGLDIDVDIKRIKNRQYKLTRPMTFPDPPIAPSRRWAWITGACFIVLFIVFNVFNYTDDDTNSIIPVPPPLQIQPEPAVIAPAAVQPDAQPEPHMADAAKDASAVASKTASKIVLDETLRPLHSFRFDAIDDAVWLQVYLPDADGLMIGELRKEVLLQPGHHITLDEPVNHLWLTTGNAGALQISVDGNIVHAAGTLGDIGKVLHDYQISADE